MNLSESRPTAGDALFQVWFILRTLREAPDGNTLDEVRDLIEAAAGCVQSVVPHEVHKTWGARKMALDARARELAQKQLPLV